jgi:4-amino-4-deoxy-L-arabinose transferase-like glycosyltransferase
MSRLTVDPVTIAESTSENRKSARRRVWGITIVVIWLAVYIPGAFMPGLLDDADATHAEAAREMHANGDYTTLHVNGIRYLEKAPFPYWLVATSYQIFGVSEFATRLPIVIAVLLSAVLAYRWALRAFGNEAASYSGLFVLTCVGCYLFTRVFIPDVWLGLLICSSLYSFLVALEEGQGPHWYWGYAALALAVLTKGLVPIVLVGATAAAYLWITGEWTRWREFRLLQGTLVFLLVAAPWHILAGVRNQGFFWFYFVNEHFLRFLGRRFPRDYNKLPAMAYWGLHLIWLFPWSLYLPLGLRELIQNVRAFRPRRSRPASFAARSRLLFAVWAAVVLTFFAFSTNQEYYTFPAYIPVSVLLAEAIAREDHASPGSRWLLLPNILYAVFGLVAGVTLLSMLWLSRGVSYVGDIGTLLVERKVGNYTLSMSHFFDLTTSAFASLRLPAFLAAAVLITGPVAALLFRIRKKTRAVALTTVCSSAIVLIAAQIALVRFEPYLSSKNLASAIEGEAGVSDRVMIYGDQAFGSSLLFYLRRPIELVDGRTTSMWFGSRFPDAPKIFLTGQDLARDWAAPGRIFLFVPADQRDHVDTLISGTRYVLAESSGKAVYTNRPK